jgi:hypothetical protein
MTGGHFNASTATKRAATRTNNTFISASGKSHRNSI